MAALVPGLHPRGTGFAAALLAMVGLSACGETDAPDDAAPVETFCADAEARLGRRVCVHEVPDLATWQAITFSAAAVDQDRVTTFLLPARDDARVPAVIVDANGFEDPEQSLHFKFLTETSEELSLLEYSEYVELALDPERREWFAGSLTAFVAADREPIYGFTVWDRGVDAASTITCEQFMAVHAELDRRVRIGPVAAVPANDLQREVIAACDVPSHDPSFSLDYELYTAGRGCGTLRRFTLAELGTADASAGVGFQDILVADEAPLDIASVIGGIVTGTRQGELSHLNVRSASRGTPNCYVKDAHALLEPFEGRLVALECSPTEAHVTEITAEDAEACQARIKPAPVEVVPLDRVPTDLVQLSELATETAEERTAAVGRYGAKGANLATLYQRIDPALQLTGFLIPVHHYDAFVRQATWSVASEAGAAPETLSFQATLERWLDDPAFAVDGALRRERLLALQSAMRDAACDADLVSAIEASVRQVWGADDVMVRFRSSSNAEDAIGFNGAGLYDSTSVCLADENDGDAVGPSLCDPDHANERDVCRGLTRVWASLWNPKAFEERAFYGIDQREVAMGILVNTRSKGELANIVAFSGNPLLRGDRRYLVNAQLGELAVVAALPGVWPEKDLLTLEDGAVTGIERARGSTELPDGEWVLDDARLEALGAALSGIVDVFPVDADVPVTARIYLDTEWKVLEDGRLVVKQVRPFLE